MIRYALACNENHRFESWFRSIGSADEQIQRALVACPVCGSSAVTKAPMAPAVAGSRSEASPDASDGAATLDSPEAAALRDMMREMRRRILAETTDVGERFAEEARRIHFGESEAQAIRGRATAEEARALAQDGIAFHPLPPALDELS